MAYDKVVDSSVLDAGLKAIADAIREKAGTSDNLAFPTAMANAIKAIEADGGGGGAAAATGTYYYNGGLSTTTPIPITHGLGAIPDFVFVFDTRGSGVYPTNIEWGLYAAMYQKSTGKCHTVVKTAAASGSNLDIYDSTVQGITSVTADQFCIGGKYAYPIQHTYRWLAVSGVA